MRTGTWQHPAQVEIRAGQLGLVEGLFSGACVQRILGLRRRLQPEAGQQHIGRILEEIHRDRADLLGIALGRGDDLSGQLAPFADARLHPARQFTQRRLIELAIAELAEFGLQR